MAAARNTGIKNATSNFITYLDADDIWKPTFLEHIFTLTQEFSEAQIFATNYEEIWETTLKTPFNGSENLAPNFKGYIDFFALNLKQGIYCHGSICFHKSVFEKIGLFDSRYFLYLEDDDFCFRAKKAGFGIVYAPAGKVWHLNSGSSSVGSLLQDYYFARNRLLLGMHWSPWRTRLALFRESIRLMLKGRKWQKVGIKDFYLGRFYQGSWKS